MEKNCLRCNKPFSKRDGQKEWHWERQVWCSSNCRSNGVKKGRPFKEKNCNWTGGRGITTQGYIEVLSTEISSKNVRGRILEHRLVMEKHLGRKLLRKEIVHHINKNKQDNRIENLELIASQSEHRKEHAPDEFTKRKISVSMLGRVFSDEHRLNLSRAAYKRYAQ